MKEQSTQQPGARRSLTEAQLNAMPIGMIVELIVADGLSPASLAIAAHMAGDLSDSAIVRVTLIPLLDHESSIVREGAIYGLTPHLDGSTRARLWSVAKVDPSPGVRASAWEALE